MTLSIDTIIMWLFVICLITLACNAVIFKHLEKKGKDVEKHKKLSATIITSLFLAIILSLFSYSLTRNNLDLLKVLFIYILFTCIFYGIYRLYKKGQKRIVKFVIVPLTILIGIFSLKILTHLLINPDFLFTLLINISILTVIHWLFYEVGEEDSDKQMGFNILYLAGIILFAIFSWHYVVKDIHLKTPICELKVESYLENKGYESDEYSVFAGRRLQRGDHEFVQVYFKDDPCTYLYEYFYDENIVRQVKIFKKQGVEPIHKDGDTEVLERN